MNLLQTDPDSSRRKNINDPVFSENNSLIEDLSQQKTKIDPGEWNNMVSWKDLDKLKEFDNEETPDERRIRKNKTNL